MVHKAWAHLVKSITTHSMLLLQVVNKLLHQLALKETIASHQRAIPIVSSKHAAILTTRLMRAVTKTEEDVSRVNLDLLNRAQEKTQLMTRALRLMTVPPPTAVPQTLLMTNLLTLKINVSKKNVNRTIDAQTIATAIIVKTVISKIAIVRKIIAMQASIMRLMIKTAQSKMSKLVVRESRILNGAHVAS